MASRRYRNRHRSRPAAGEVGAVLNALAVLSGSANADTTAANADADSSAFGASADNPASAFAGASVPGTVARLWAASTCADMTPARVYLSRCGCWPGRHVRAPLPLASVRWLAPESAPEREDADGWHGLPPGAAGAVVFAWWRADELAAVTLVALDARGFAVREARSTFGPIGGATFRAGARGDVGAVTVRADADGHLHAPGGWLQTPWLDVLGGRRR